MTTVRSAFFGACVLSLIAAAPAARDQDAAREQGAAREQAGAREQRAARAQDSTVSLDKWPEVAQKAYKEMKAKYGEPDGVTPTRLVWRNKAPFTEIILIDEAIDHNFPKPHKDCLEHVVAYDVPVEKVGELAKFDGSIIVDRTRGTISARCDSEQHNLFALNLADDIVKGKKSVEQARQAYAQAAKQQMAGKMPEIGKQLQFQPAAKKTGDPDVAIIGPQADNPQAGQAQPAAGQQSPDRQPPVGREPAPEQPRPQQQDK